MWTPWSTEKINEITFAMDSHRAWHSSCSRSVRSFPSFLIDCTPWLCLRRNEQGGDRVVRRWAFRGGPTDERLCHLRQEEGKERCARPKGQQVQRHNTSYPTPLPSHLVPYKGSTIQQPCPLSPASTLYTPVCQVSCARVVHYMYPVLSLGGPGEHFNSPASPQSLVDQCLKE